MDSPCAASVARRAAATEVAAVLLAVLSTVAVAFAHVTGRTPNADPPLLDGSAGYVFLHVDPKTQLPARFNPCAPVAYVVNPASAPRGALDDVHEAFRRAALATGLAFTYEGETDEQPVQERRAYQPQRYGERWAPVLVAWADVSDVSAPHRTDVLGWATQTLMTHPTRQDVVVSGTVVLADDATGLRPGFGPGRRWGNVALHEVGHLLGLGHTVRRGEIMYPDVAHARGEWGEGDLAGLAHLGRDAGCVRVPDAR